MSIEEFAKQFPQTVTLEDKTRIEVRLMQSDERDAVLAFARALPEQDLLFLRVDITQTDTVDTWMSNLASGTTTSLAAYDGDRLVGYASVHRDPTPWTRRVGEIRVNVGPEFRARGLGRHLTAKIFDAARAVGLKKLMASMTTDQRGAQAAFKRLGFMPEALLSGFAEDREGNLRDLVIMSYDMDGLTDQIDEPLAV